MSDVNSVLNSLRNAYAAIGEIEAVAAREPGDRYVLANLSSLKRDAEKLEALWEEECRHSRIEVCRYRLLPTNSGYSITSISRSWQEFQELFSQVYDAVKNGIKARARITADLAQETSFEFGYSYPGSLGVALMVPSETTLFNSKYDTAVEAFMQIASISNEDEVRDMAKKLGQAVVRKAYDWANTNFHSGYGVDVTWTNAKGLKKGGLVETGALGKIADLIARTSDIERVEFSVRGVLVGVDVKTKRFRFIDPNGEDYAGPLSDVFPIHTQWAINTPYTAQILAESVTEYATQQKKTTYRLMNLQTEQST